MNDPISADSRELARLRVMRDQIWALAAAIRELHFAPAETEYFRGYNAAEASLADRLREICREKDEA